MKNSEIYIGLMSGTSLDGVDGVMVQFSNAQNSHEAQSSPMTVLASAQQVFSEELKLAAMALQQSGENEIHREALLANQLAKVYADCVDQLKKQRPDAIIQAIGVHGQTIRHRPELGYTKQTNNPALLAELTGIDVIADFRSRDIAAGGQGAPLVPAFHRAIFGSTLQQGKQSVVVNIGGMSNISILHADGKTSGFDTGPGNVLMDAWILRHQKKAYDKDGEWAAQGKVDTQLLSVLSDEDFFHLAPPKSTGRDLFHLQWLDEKLKNFSHLLVEDVKIEDVQASLCALTAKTIVDAIQQYALPINELDAVYVCGGGAFNQTLMKQIKHSFPNALVTDTSHLGVDPQQVEAIAFAWLAQQFTLRKAGNMPQVTGAKGERILGALYPA
jgi:anhydro-N-acetylmuramic acid kinase